MNLDKRLDEIEKKLDIISSTSYSMLGNQVSSFDDEIDLREVWNTLWSGKWIIIATTFAFAVASVAYALSLPNMYKSEVLLAPAEENSGGGLAGMAGQFGGLASLAGVNLGGGGADKTVLALNVLKSREFISYFIEKHDLLVALMASKGWDREKDALILDADIYDRKESKWARDVAPPNKAEPSSQEAHEVFHSHFSVSQDKETSFVSLSFEFYSPSVSKQWVDWLVEDINTKLKERDVAEAERSIKYLTGQLEKTPVAEMQGMFYELIEEQTKTMMFAEVRDEYVFKTIDSAVVPELKSKPKRALILMLGIILGGIIGVFVVLVRCFFKKAVST